MQGELLGGTPRSFAAPGRGEGRIGVVDAGSNSIRLVIYEGGRRSPAVLFNEKVMAGLGARLTETGKLDPDGKERAMAALVRFAAMAELLHVSALAGVATAAIRDAEDGPAFRDEIEKRTGIRLAIASGQDEARLAAQGVLFGNPEAEGVVVDLGGASMEFARVGGGRVRHGLSTPLGPLRLMAFDSDKAVDREIDGHLAALDGDYTLGGEGRLYLVGGSWRALARCEMERTEYPLKLLHEYEIEADRARALGEWASKQSCSDLAAIPGVADKRADVLPMAGRLFVRVLDALKPASVMVSGFGLREGICLANLAPPLRPLDPLLAACRAQERARARAPGFGSELAEFVLRIVTPVDDEEKRLIRAACHLADVNWRSHPDYRVNGCWDSVTRATITNIGHRHRAMLGAALSFRYRRSVEVLESYEAVALLPNEDRERSMLIGMAMRLGCALSGVAPGVLPDMGIETGKGSLMLTLPKARAELSGEELDKRLGHVARALNLESKVTTG